MRVRFRNAEVKHLAHRVPEESDRNPGRSVLPALDRRSWRQLREARHLLRRILRVQGQAWSIAWTRVFAPAPASALKFSRYQAKPARMAPGSEYCRVYSSSVAESIA